MIWAMAAMAAMAVGTTGCLHDDNNYDYKDVNQLQSLGGSDGMGNIKSEYSVLQGEELTLAPTFKFTIDSVSPDVSYEWYVDRELQAGETGPEFVFKSEHCGSFEVTFVVMDNKSGLRFAASTTVKVRSLYQRGWGVLSDEGGRSVLHFIQPTTMTYEAVDEDGNPVMRDSLVYHTVLKDVVPDLGTGPVGLMDNIGDMDYYGDYGIDEYDELVVMQDRWAELNGNTLEREVWTDQEFGDDLPDGFAPKEAAMNSTTKAVLDENGRIYWMNKGDITDFHAGFYTSVGLNNNQKFSRLFQGTKWNDYYSDVILALRAEDNSFVGIYDGAKAYNGTAISESNQHMCGTVYDITDEEGKFKAIDKEVVDALPAAYDGSQDISMASSGWLALLRNKADRSSYELRYFLLDGEETEVTCEDYCEYPGITMSDYRDMAVFNNRHYAVLADGSQLYYFQYLRDPYSGYEGSAVMMPLGGPLPSPVKALHGFDLYSYAQSYYGQLGVALEDGSVYIFSVVEQLNEDGVCQGVSRTQAFPDENTPEEDRNFGRVVDILYKLGRGMDYMGFTF